MYLYILSVCCNNKYLIFFLGDREADLITPDIGRRRFIGALHSRGIHIQRWRVIECLHRCDPIGTALRWRSTIKRRKYWVPFPNSLWHIDSCHKLILYKIIIHVCIDGKSRLLLYVSAKNNNKAETVLKLFEQAVDKWGLPSRVRSDHGMENYHVGSYMINHRGSNRGSIITGSSVHNTRVERVHRDVFLGVLYHFKQLFDDMVDQNILDIYDDIQLFSLHYIFLPRIERSIQEFVNQMNHRPVSTENNKSPMQMWHEGMLNHTDYDTFPLTDNDIEQFGIDPDILPVVYDTDYQVNVDPPNINLNDETTLNLPDPLYNDSENGIALYLETVHILKSL